MSSLAGPFINQSTLLLAEYLSKLTASLVTIKPDDVWWRPNEASNSIANLLLHLRGNVTQWIIGGVGRRPFQRVRPDEFSARDGATVEELLAQLTATVHEACGIIAVQDEGSLAERRQIQGYDVSVLDAIYHVVEHFSMHTGQIILLAKARGGSDLRLWQAPTPS